MVSARVAGKKHISLRNSPIAIVAPQQLKGDQDIRYHTTELPAFLPSSNLNDFHLKNRRSSSY
jgi:hypothetical protein